MPGVLLVRMSEAGTREFFYRSRAGGIDRTQKVGEHGATSLLEARKKARALAGNPVALEAPGTFGDLLGAYVAHLKAQGKVSAADVERTLLRALPAKDALRKRRASAITSRDVTAIIARRLREGVTVEANRLRSHLSAAFKFGMHADYNPARARPGRVVQPSTVRTPPAERAASLVAPAGRCSCAAVELPHITASDDKRVEATQD